MATVDGVFGSDHVDSNQIPRGRSESTLSFSISRNSMDMEASTKRKVHIECHGVSPTHISLVSLGPHATRVTKCLTIPVGKSSSRSRIALYSES